MAKLLLNLRHVPDDEADEVRALLATHAIEYYETKPNRWGISAGGIWLRHERDVERARQLLADYQQDRATKARAAWEAARQSGEAETIRSVIRDKPLQVAAMLAVILLVLALSAVPFVLLLR
jgi:hypothetical protein